MTDDLRTILREELARDRRIRAGDRWVDGCRHCDAPTHGAADNCPYASLPACTELRHRVESASSTVARDGYLWRREDFKCTKCGACGHTEERS